MVLGSETHASQMQKRNSFATFVAGRYEFLPRPDWIIDSQRSLFAEVISFDGIILL